MLPQLNTPASWKRADVVARLDSLTKEARLPRHILLKDNAVYTSSNQMPKVVIENPILNSPYDEPKRHFYFDEDAITDRIVDTRRVSSYFVPHPEAQEEGKATRTRIIVDGGPH